MYRANTRGAGGRGADRPVVNSLGAPIDDKGPVEAEETSPIEKVAPGVISRQSVSQPVQTGLKSIDSMVPVGRGQRELIIGDRQTGKPRWPSTPSSTRRQGSDLHLRGHRPEGLQHCQRSAQTRRARRHGPHHSGGGASVGICGHAVHRAVFRVLHGRILP